MFLARRDVLVVVVAKEDVGRRRVTQKLESWGGVVCAMQFSVN
jgi:hypothetical protein